MTAVPTAWVSGGIETDELRPLEDAVVAVSGLRPLCEIELVGRVARLRVPFLGSCPAGSTRAREALLQAGALLFDLRLRLIGAGHRPVVWPSGSPSGQPVIAMIRIGGTGTATPDERMLLTALDRSDLRRIPGLTRTFAPHLLRRAAEIEGAALHSALPGIRRAEISSWFGPEHDALPETAPAMVLSTANDLALTRLEAGQALRRVELTASALGVSISTAVARTLPPSPRLARNTVAQAAVLIGEWPPAGCEG